MPTPDERVSYLEGRVEEHTRHMDEILRAIGALEHRFDRVEQRLDAVESRMDRFEVRMDRLEMRMDRLEDKMSRQFVWLAGMQVTTLAAVLGAFAAAVTAFVR